MGVSVVSVTLEDGTLEFVREAQAKPGASSAGNGCCERSTMGLMSGVEGKRGGFVGRRGGERGGGGDGGGVLRCEACETMSGGGRAFGEMMMPGASVGSWGLRDQMAHFAIPGSEVGWVDSCAVDIEPMWEYDEEVGGGVCGGGGRGISDSVGGSWGVMGAEGWGIDNCLGNGDTGCCCCCCQDGVKTGALGDG